MSGEKETYVQEMIVVLDFGSKYNQLLTRRIREIGVYSELHPHTVTAEKLKEMNPKGIILAGAPGDIAYDEQIFHLGIPVLGIGFGMNIMAKHFGVQIEETNNDEYDKTNIKIEANTPLFKGLSKEQTVWMSPTEPLKELPSGFSVAAKSESQSIVAMSDEEKQLYAMQFHPEVEHSIHGKEMLNNFVLKVCQCKGNWSMKRFIEVEVEKIRRVVGDKKVLCALSGGVDSSVVAVLIHKAIGDQLTCIFVDHGLLRKGEAESVVDTFADQFQMNVIAIDAKERFLNKLAGVSDPEKKRKIIGNEFIYVFDDEAKKLKEMEFLAQGTLYSDVIESGTANGQTIKSHHNVGGLPEDMEFELIEPLKTLFKDEVRMLGTELGIPDEIVWRQPFPGPGLAIRILGEITEEKLKIVRESDYILREEIKKAGLDRKIWQYFTVLPGIRSVGVANDARTYDYTVGIRAVHSVDGMTSDWARIPWDVLEVISKRIVNEVDHVNRIVYDITSKPPATIEWE